MASINHHKFQPKEVSGPTDRPKQKQGGTRVDYLHS